MNILFCSAGKRVELIKEIKKSITGRIIVTDASITAPSIYVADKAYNIGFITEIDYIERLLEICVKESINAITTLIDPEIEILAENRERFENIGVIVLAPSKETAALCFDKSKLIQYLTQQGVRTVKTWTDIESFEKALEHQEYSFPVFIKPKTGSGSVGARYIDSMRELRIAVEKDAGLLIQENMGDADDIDVDVYIDTISHKLVSIFSKKKIETKIGGASKTVSFIDDELSEYIERIIQMLDFSGPIDMDFFCRDGEYYLSEINPRFGGAYIHAYEAGVDFFKLIENNIKGIENKAELNMYDEDLVMMMYDSLIIKKIPMQKF